jgi:hypothetical protein
MTESQSATDKKTRLLAFIDCATKKKSRLLSFTDCIKNETLKTPKRLKPDRTVSPT